MSAPLELSRKELAMKNESPTVNAKELADKLYPNGKRVTEKEMERTVNEGTAQ